eukprot:849618-Alexandrium_andersonii.AAC.1
MNRALGAPARIDAMVAAPWWSAPETVLPLAMHTVCLRVLAGCTGHRTSADARCRVCEHGARDQGRTGRSGCRTAAP